MTTPPDLDCWPRLAALPLVIEGYELEGLTAEMTGGMVRLTIQIRLRRAPATTVLTAARTAGWRPFPRRP